MSFVTVILPAFNVAEHLRTCLVALTRQMPPGREVEVIVVDNNSTDDTVAIARDFPSVRLLHEPKQGSYAARNLGVRESTGEFVVFLDPDCAPREGWLDAALRGLEDSGAAIVLGRRHYGPSRALSLLSLYEDEKIQWILRRGGADQVYGYTNNMAVRRSVLEAHGPFPERMRGGDTMFVQRVVAARGIGAVAFEGAMGVDHLEVTTLGDYYHKRTIYGASNERLSHEVPFRPLTGEQRFAVLRSLLTRGRVTPLGALVLLVLLVPGAIAYDWARQGAR
ncbi:MAG: glycosyltransferase family A protein [Gemmatimonadaceae bacterium]